MMKIRYHHLMCIPRYKGEGYSREFCENLRKVKESIHEEDYTLVDCCDDICLFCPNNENGICKDSEKVSRYDTLVKGKILKGEAFLLEEICSDCSWFDICRNIKI
ncbi:MAG: DUF1284 domain-containing protein [Eubacterium sp.]|nr:DUF1284 domain-containing protein [Eubacterium sp.]